MRMSIVSISLLLFLGMAPSAFAAELWQDLEIGDRVALNQTITLRENSIRTFELLKDSAFKIEDVAALPGLSVVLFGLASDHCVDVNFKSEMELVLPVADPSANSEVGVIFGEDCKFEIYVEAKDLARPGLLNR